MIACHPDRLAAAAAQIEAEVHGYMGSSDIAFDNLWASQRAVAESCSQRAIDNVSDLSLTFGEKVTGLTFYRVSACTWTQRQ